MSHIRHLRAKGLPSHSGKQWPGRLQPSTQIYHNPIKPADFTIICRLSQPGSSKQIQPILHKSCHKQACPTAWQIPPGAWWRHAGEWGWAHCKSLGLQAMKAQLPTTPCNLVHNPVLLHWQNHRLPERLAGTSVSIWSNSLSSRATQNRVPRICHKDNLRSCHLLLSLTAHSQFSPKWCFFSSAANSYTFTSEEEGNRGQNVIFSKERKAILNSSIVQWLFPWPVSAQSCTNICDGAVEPIFGEQWREHVYAASDLGVKQFSLHSAIWADVRKRFPEAQTEHRSHHAVYRKCWDEKHWPEVCCPEGLWQPPPMVSMKFHAGHKTHWTRRGRWNFTNRFGTPSWAIQASGTRLQGSAYFTESQNDRGWKWLLCPFAPTTAQGRPPGAFLLKTHHCESVQSLHFEKRGGINPFISWPYPLPHHRAHTALPL